MAKVEDVARSALAAIATDANLVIAGQWVNERLQDAASNIRFRFLRTFGAVQIPASLGAGNTSGVNQGVATATRDSAIVTGDADAALLWDQSLVGRYFNVLPRTAWYQITAVDNNHALHLAVPFSEDSVSGAAYHIVQRGTSLPGVRHLGPAVHQRFRIPLQLITYEGLNQLFPERQYFSYCPTMYAEVGEDESGAKLIEFYPYSGSSEVVNYVAWGVPPKLELEDQIPGSVDVGLLKQGVLVDAMRYAASTAAMNGKMEQAAYWRNEYRMQEGRWKEVIDRLALTDHGVDDSTFILAMSGSWGLTIGRDIRTAYDFVYVQGNRP